jgi:hypothetical protein
MHSRSAIETTGIEGPVTVSHWHCCNTLESPDSRSCDHLAWHAAGRWQTAHEHGLPCRALPGLHAIRNRNKQKIMQCAIQLHSIIVYALTCLGSVASVASTSTLQNIPAPHPPSSTLQNIPAARNPIQASLAWCVCMHLSACIDAMPMTSECLQQ